MSYLLSDVNKHQNTASDPFDLYFLSKVSTAVMSYHWSQRRSNWFKCCNYQFERLSKLVLFVEEVKLSVTISLERIIKSANNTLWSSGNLWENGLMGFSETQSVRSKKNSLICSIIPFNPTHNILLKQSNSPAQSFYYFNIVSHRMYVLWIAWFLLAPKAH